MGGGVRGGGVRGGGVRGRGVRGGMTCGTSLPLLSTAPFVQESWRKDLGEEGREGEREGGGGREKMNRNIYYMYLSWRKGAGYNL